MATQRLFLPIEFEPMADTRAALHAYAQILGDWLKSCRPRRKHWWHASLRPSLTGLTTGVVHAGTEFELQLDLRSSRIVATMASGSTFSESIRGQSASEVSRLIAGFLLSNGVDEQLAPDDERRGNTRFDHYSADYADQLQQVLTAVHVALQTFRSGIREETSPIQLWPHHFDLAMLWLPGEKIAGEDPEDEESSDKQMNFGFTFGDAGIAEPYFYITAYPTPGGFSGLTLPDGTRWQTEGFTGAVLHYRSLVEMPDPGVYLQGLWNTMLSAGRSMI